MILKLTNMKKIKTGFFLGQLVFFHIWEQSWARDRGCEFKDRTSLRHLDIAVPLAYGLTHSAEDLGLLVLIYFWLVFS